MKKENYKMAEENLKIIKFLKLKDIIFEKEDEKTFIIKINKSLTIAKFRSNSKKLDLYIYSQHSKEEYYKNGTIEFKNEVETKKYLFNLLKWKYKNRKIVKNGKIVFPYKNVEN